ncbi:MAG: hypothetical protein ABFE07_16215 [Armatimonadia bacterium]
MARRWWYYAFEDGDMIKVQRYDEHYSGSVRSERQALLALSNSLADEVRTRLNKIDAIRAGKVTRTWVEKRK